MPEALHLRDGTNTWRSLRCLAAQRAHTEMRRLYFGPGRETLLRSPREREPRRLRRLRLRPGAPGALPPPADPAHVLPGRLEWSTWLVEDQRFVDDRDDVLTWETAHSTEDLTIAGEVVANL